MFCLKKKPATETLTTPLPKKQLKLSAFSRQAAETRGRWTQHVKQARSNYTTRKATIEAVTSWLASCDNFYSPNTHFKKLYTLKDALKNVRYWNEKVAENENAFDDEQIDLLVLGLLRAQLSNGNDKPRGFPGIFQADVLTRRGVIAIGGYARGSESSIVFF